MPPRVFITGASGFLGRALAERVRAAGGEALGVDRSADPANGVVAGDVAVPGPWQDHAAGCDVVVHTAAIVSLRLRAPDEVWRVNVLGTHHAVRAAEGAGARFVHLSSVTVFGFTFPDRVDESYPVRPTGVPYPDTKIASEQVVLQAHAEGRVKATVVRPGDVYGPRSAAWAVQPVELMKARRWVLPDGGRGLFSPVYVDDVARGILAAAEHADAPGQVITLSGGHGMANRDFFGHYARALGVRMPTVPTRVARVAAAMAQRLDRGGTGDVNPRAVEYMLRRGTYSIVKAEELLAWRPEVDVVDGLQRTLAWLEATGRI